MNLVILCTGYSMINHARMNAYGTERVWAGEAVGRDSAEGLNSQAEQRCPICRGAWEFKQLNTGEGDPPPLRDQ